MSDPSVPPLSNGSHLPPRVGLYAGTFDPITNGHLDILRRSLRIFDRMIVAIAPNVRKSPLFTLEERMELIREAIADDPAAGRIEYDALAGLLVEYCKAKGATTLVRGLRALADFEYEFQFAHMNRRLAPSVDTMFLMTAEENFFVSSSLVKEVAQFGGNIAGFVPPGVRVALERKYAAGGSR